MKKIIAILILFLCFPYSVFSYSTSANCAILMDQDSGRIIYSKNINTVRSVASISKIMTGILAVESGKLEKKVTIGNEIDKAYGSGIYIKHNEELKIKDLVYGLMLRSGNDAALAIAHHVGGSVDKFVAMMNKKAKEIGMTNTTFNNPSGLDEDKGNYSTAYDMAILASYAMKNKSYQKIVGTKKYTLKTNLNTYIWYNKNKLLNSYEYTTGGKTGFTKIARRTLVSTATKDNLNLVVVTLNDGNDFLDHKNLYIEAYKEYKNYKILKKGIITIDDKNYYKNFEYYIKKDYNYPLSDSEKDNVTIKYTINKIRNYKNNSKVGYASIYLGDKVIDKIDIYIKEKVQKKQSLLSKILKKVIKHDE